MNQKEIDDLLALDVPARLATLDEDGHPRITPIWFVWEDGAFYMTSVVGKIQLRNLMRDPRPRSVSTSRARTPAVTAPTGRSMPRAAPD